MDKDKQNKNVQSGYKEDMLKYKQQVEEYKKLFKN